MRWISLLLVKDNEPKLKEIKWLDPVPQSVSRRAWARTFWIQMLCFFHQLINNVNKTKRKLWKLCIYYLNWHGLTSFQSVSRWDRFIPLLLMPLGGSKTYLGRWPALFSAERALISEAAWFCSRRMSSDVLVWNLWLSRLAMCSWGSPLASLSLVFSSLKGRR